MTQIQDSGGSDLGLGIGAAFVALMLWAAPVAVAKGLPLAALTIVFYRLWLGLAWSLVALLLARRRLTWKGLKASAWGGFTLAIDLIFFFSALKFTTVANATVIGALTPLLLLFAAPLIFGERLRLPDVLAALCAIGGLVLVVQASTELEGWSLKGDLLAVVTLVAWTGYFVASKKARQSVGSNEFTAAVTLIATALVTPVVLWTGTPLEVEKASWWLALALMAVAGWSGHLLMNWALGRIPVWFGGVASLATPIAASLMAWLLLDEVLLPRQWLGMVIVVVALTVSAARAGQVQAPTPVESAS